MQLEFAPPAPALQPYISIYYFVRFDYPLIEDVERADVGYLRMMFSGTGAYRFKSGAIDRDCRAMLLGPATETATYSLQGPLETFGCVLLPQFWGGIVRAGADEFANRARDATDVFGQGILALHDRLRAMNTVEDMARAMDAFLIPHVRAIPAEQRRVIARITEWLACFPIPAPDALYAVCTPSPRQVMRLSNRFFGAPPKLLARKFRALRTASRLIGTRGPVPDDLVAEYSDRAHMTREIKTFTGLTPRGLQINSNPILQVTLHPDNFRMEAPWT